MVNSTFKISRAAAFNSKAKRISDSSFVSSTQTLTEDKKSPSL